jgi:hypothetical protein
VVEAPSGELVDPNAEIIVPVSQLYTGFRNQSFDFPAGFTISPNTRYWIVVSRTGSHYNT